MDLAAFKSNIPPPFEDPSPILTYLDKTLVPASYHDQWMFEGLSRYLAVMSNDADGSQLRRVLDDARDQLRPVEDAGPIWLGQRLASTITPAGYRAVYSKGLWVIHMLRTMMRQEGPAPDAKFVSMLQEFVALYGGKTASTWDLKHLAEKYADKKLDWFFDEWVFGTGVPAYTADYKIEPSGSEFTIEGMIKQSNVPDGFVMSVPVYADDEYLGRVQVSDAEGEFRFRVAKKPDRLVIDPEKTILSAVSQ